MYAYQGDPKDQLRLYHRRSTHDYFNKSDM